MSVSLQIGDMKSYDSMKNLCEKYNSALREILDVSSFSFALHL